ncbi:MAG: hypothetical protein LBN36_04940 [Clostridiales Family XIII bacterium]|jgi:hypothetical protein|nr:hypothetical protein [Clostridiales Family XIII bacterium]
MGLDRAEKLNLMKSLNWDYRTSAEDMLDVIEGRLPQAGAFDQGALFVRSLERLPWHYVVALWGVEAMDLLYTQEIRKHIWPADRRETFDVAFKILRGEPVSSTGWSIERSRKLRDTFLSDRWNRPESGILSS